MIGGAGTRCRGRRWRAGRQGDGGGIPTTALPRPAPAPPRSPLPTRLLTFLLGTGIIVQRSRATDMLNLDDGALAAVTAGRCGAMADGVRATAIGMRRRASCAALEMMGAMVSLRSDYTWAAKVGRGASSS